MGNRRQRLRLGLLAAVWLAVAGIGVFFYEDHLFRRAELDTVDQRFTIRGTQPRPNDLAVVAIDDVTFDDLQLQWPFPRHWHARAIDELRRQGAKVIAYDIQFTEPTKQAEDLALFDAVSRAGNVVLGTTEVNSQGGTNVLGGDQNVHEAHAVAANASLPPDPNGVLRRFNYSIDGLQTMPVLTDLAAGEKVRAADFPKGGAWIDYRGPARTIRTIHFSDLVNHKLPPGSLKNKIVVVGASAPSLQDVHATPTDDVMPGPEIQANAIWTIRHGFPLKSTPEWLDVLLIVLLALGPALIGFLLPPLTSPALTILRAAGFALPVLGAYLVAAQLSFNGGRIIPVVYPVAALLLSTAGSLGVNYFTEGMERRRTRQAFARFVPESVVDQVLAQAADGLRLGGTLMHGTLMFSDVRGFTTFSERTPAARVIEVLNRYLTEMTEAILDHGGTLVSYMGDGIMAVFGAPVPQEDHADRGLAAAREMIEVRLPRFNEWMREQEVPEGFRIGIGLNSGPFMAGNVGSERRLEYTTIGDTVNTASRIEGMTKGTGHSLFLASSTRDALTTPVEDLVFVEEMPVRGRQAGIEIWGLASEAATAARGESSEAAPTPEPH